MIYLSSPALSFALRVPMSTAAEVQGWLDAALAENRTWAIPSDDCDDVLLINPAAMPVVWLTEAAPTGAQRVTTVGPGWRPPDTLAGLEDEAAAAPREAGTPDELADAEEASS